MDKNAIFRSEFEKIPIPYPDQKLKNAIITLANVYGNENTDRRGTEVDYDQSEFRTAYMYKYHDMHAQLSTMALRLIVNKGKRCSENLRQEAASSFDPSTFLADLRGKETLTVTSIGGGSGADLAGFYRFWSKDLLQEEDALCKSRDDIVKNLRLTNLDFYEGWRECSVGYMRLLGADEFYRFVRVDVLGEDVAIVQEQMKISDLVIMCRFLSAVFYHETGLKNHIKKMVRDMRPGAYLLLIDNMYATWDEDCLKWMKETLMNESKDVKCSLLLHYGNPSFEDKVGYGISLDPELKQEAQDQYKEYQKQTKLQEQLMQKVPQGVGFQLWQKI